MAIRGLSKIHLPERMEYTGEFGPEFIIFMPFVYWLSEAGILRRKTVISYEGMRCFYDDLDCKEYVEKPGPRAFDNFHNRSSYYPNIDENDLHRTPFYSHPDLRRKFASLPLSLPANYFHKPILIVHNKFNFEWGCPPINFFSLDCLERIFSIAEDYFNIIYIRHKSSTLPCWDQNEEATDFDETRLLAKFSQVNDFDKLYAEFGGQLSLNAFKTVICSRSYHFISVQGGGAHYLSYFSGSAIGILHRRGPEIMSAYSSGLYKVTSNPSPHIMVCLSEDDVIDAVYAMTQSQLIGDRVMFDNASKSILWHLDAKEQRDRFFKNEHAKRIEKTNPPSKI